MRTLTSMVAMAGVGVAESSTALEVLARQGMSTSGAIDAILGGLACALLPAGVVVPLIARTGAPQPAV